MHGDLLAQLGQLVLVAGGLERDQHADLAEARLDRVVDIRDHHAVGHGQNLRAAQGHVLADGRDVVGQLLLNGAAGLRIRDALESLDVLAMLQSQLRHGLDEVLERVVARHEVGLGVDLHDRALGALDGSADEALGRHTSGLLRRRGQALRAEPIHGRVEIAVRLGQGLFAIHHACAGLLAQFFHQSSRDSHG